MPDARTAAAISRVLQEYLARERLDELTAVEAARVLDRAGVLTDSPSRPGKPLRDYLRAGLIEGQHQEPNGRWFVRCLTGGFRPPRP